MNTTDYKHFIFVSPFEAILLVQMSKPQLSLFFIGKLFVYFHKMCLVLMLQKKYSPCLQELSCIQIPN